MSNPTFAEKCRAKGTTPGAVYTVWAVIAFIIWAVFFTGPTSEEKAKLKAESAKLGLHCLSPLDGSYAAAIKHVKGNLRDPDSFQHIRTVTTDKDSEGRVPFGMEYRAKNGFGGFNVTTTYGMFSSADCQILIIF